MDEVDIEKRVERLEVEVTRLRRRMREMLGGIISGANVQIDSAQRIYDDGRKNEEE